MTPVMLHSPTFANTTFISDLFFLHDQDSFDQFIVEHPPLPNHVLPRWDTAIKSALWSTFCQLLHYRYVGTLDSINSFMSVKDITSLFCDLKMVPRQAVTAHTFPDLDALYEAFVTRLPALTDDASNWPIILPLAFHETLPKELCKKLDSDGYVLPQPTTLSSKATQHAALTSLQAAAVASWHRLSEDRESLLSYLGLTTANVKSFLSST